MPHMKHTGLHMTGDTTNNALSPDLCIIGPGYGGRLVAIRGAANGASVLHICNDSSTLPLSDPAYISRSFIEAANLVYSARTKAPALLCEYGEKLAPLPLPDYKNLTRHLQIIKEALFFSLGDEHLKAMQVHLLKGKAEFRDRKTLIVGNQHITAKHYVLAPATKWSPPTIPGLSEIKYLTPDIPITSSSMIERLVVIGTSGTALALAQAHARIGASVTLLPLPDFKPESFNDEIICQALMSLENDGILLKLTSPVHRIETKNHNIIIHTEDGISLIASHVLVAPSRTSCFTDIELDGAEIQLKNEHPLLDGLLRTSNKNVYVIGTQRDDEIFSVAHEYQANLIVDHALLRRAPTPPTEMHIIPTTPEIAMIGLNEQQAHQKYHKIHILRSSYSLHPLRLARSRQKTPIAGEIKIIVTSKKRIVGCSIIGDDASGIAGLWALAIARKLTLQDLTSLYFPDLSFHSITHHASNISIFGWKKFYGFWVRLLRLWQSLLGRISPHE